MRFPWTRTEGWAQCRYPKKGKGYWHYWRPMRQFFVGSLCRRPRSNSMWDFPWCYSAHRLHRKPKGECCPVCAWGAK